MTTIIIGFVVVLLAVGLAALYREVGIGRGSAGTSHWPFGNLAVGSAFAGASEDSFTGFLALCADDDDVLGTLYSVAVVAEEWDYPLLVAIGRTSQPSAWTHRLDGLPGNVSQHEMSSDEIRLLRPVGLPVAAFLNDGRVVDASVALDSPSSIAGRFQHCRFGLTR